MKTRGRTSKADQAVIEQQRAAAEQGSFADDEAATTATPRPRPPAQLGDEASQVWWRVVNARPADWFGAESHDLLVQYCNCVVSLDRLQQSIDVVEQGSTEVDLKAWGDLLARRDGVIKTLAMLSTRMRLNQQSRYSARRGEEGGVPAVPATDGEDDGPKPWE